MHILSISNGTDFFEVQLCIERLVFKEKHVFPILIILCLGTSLPIRANAMLIDVALLILVSLKVEVNRGTSYLALPRTTLIIRDCMKSVRLLCPVKMLLWEE